MLEPAACLGLGACLGNRRSWREGRPYQSHLLSVRPVWEPTEPQIEFALWLSTCPGEFGLARDPEPSWLCMWWGQRPPLPSPAKKLSIVSVVCCCAEYYFIKRKEDKGWGAAWLVECPAYTDKALGLVVQHCLKQRWCTWLSFQWKRCTACSSIQKSGNWKLLAAW